MKKITLFLFALCLPLIAWAQAVVPPTDLGSAAAFLPSIIAAFKNGQYLAAGALIALIVTWAVKTYVLPKLSIPSGVLPIVAAVVGILGGVGLAVANGGTLGAASMAVLSGPLAGTLWEAIVQYLVPAPAATAASLAPKV